MEIIAPNVTLFDFQGIPYSWGGTNPNEGLDCFTLYNYVLYKYQHKMLPGYDWLRGEYLTHDSSPENWVDLMADELFGEDNQGQKGEPFHLHIMDWYGRKGVGSVIKYMGAKYFVITGKRGSVVAPYQKFKSRVRRVFTPYNICFDSETFYGKKY